MYHNIDTEKALVYLFLISGIVFLIEPTRADYPAEAALFPQLTASVVVIGCILILLGERLPSTLATIVTRNISLAGDNTGEVQEEEQQEEEQPAEEVSQSLGELYGYDINDSLFTGISLILFVIVGYAIGFLYITPLFVFGYAHWFRVSLRNKLLITILSIIIVIILMEVANVPFHQGELILQEGI
jgi:hypothetical protein